MVAACNLALVVHGIVVLLIGQLAGVAFFRAINASPERDGAVQMWRMSHAASTAGAVFLIALAPVVPHLAFAPIPASLVVSTTIVSSYLLSAGTVVAAFSGHRGTQPRQPWPNLAVYAMYVAGAIGSTLSAASLLYGALRAT
jgi:hypothetical protein